MKWELPDVQAGFRKDWGTRDQITNIDWIIKEARDFQKSNYFCFIDYAKAFDCVDHNKLRKILKEMGTSDHLTCLLRNQYAGEEATVRTLCEQQTCSKLGKEYLKAIFNFYTEWNLWNTGLEEPQIEIKIARSNVNYLRFADDTTLWQKSTMNLRDSWWKWKRSVKKLAWNSMFKNSDHGIWSHHFMTNRSDNSENRVNFLGLQNHCSWWLQPWN